MSAPEFIPSARPGSGFIRNLLKIILGGFAAVFGVIATIFRGIAEIFHMIIDALWNNPVTDAAGVITRRYRIYVVVGGLLFLMVFIFFFPHFVVTVGAGEAAVEWSRFRGGTIPDKVYSEGMNLKNPFNRVVIYDIRKHEIRHEMMALSNDGLYVGVDLSIRYQPEPDFLPVLHQKIGPDYARKVVIPEVESEIRKTIGRFTPEQLFTTQGSVLEDMLKGSFSQVSENFVTLDDVLITKISLPDQIRAAIEAKLTQEQMMKEYRFKIEREKREAERKIIEAGGIEEYNRIVNNSLTDRLLTWGGIDATKEIAKSPNSKVIIMGNSKESLPVILNAESQ